MLMSRFSYANTSIFDDINNAASSISKSVGLNCQDEKDQIEKLSNENNDCSSRVLNLQNELQNKENIIIQLNSSLAAEKREIQKLTNQITVYKNEISSSRKSQNVPKNNLNENSNQNNNISKSYDTKSENNQKIDSQNSHNESKNIPSDISNNTQTNNTTLFPIENSYYETIDNEELKKYALDKIDDLKYYSESKNPDRFKEQKKEKELVLRAIRYGSEFLKEEHSGVGNCSDEIKDSISSLLIEMQKNDKIFVDDPKNISVCIENKHGNGQTRYTVYGYTQNNKYGNYFIEFFQNSIERILESNNNFETYLTIFRRIETALMILENMQKTKKEEAIKDQKDQNIKKYQLNLQGN